MRGSVLFIGTATTLIRFGGFTILTDPNFLHRGEQAHLGYGLRSRRRTDPALEIEQLPALDLIVLSHMHGDHFDRIAKRRLYRGTPIVTTRQAARVLRGWGFRAPIALETWQRHRVEKGGVELTVTALPGKHGPGVVNALLPQVMGSLLEFRNAAGDGAVALRLYVSGDTLVHDRLHEIPRRFPEIDLALLHLGGTRILGIMVTMDGKQGVEALRIVAPQRAIPIHHDDYPVFKSPLSDFQREVEAAGLSDRVIYLERGEAYEFAGRAPA